VPPCHVEAALYVPPCRELRTRGNHTMSNTIYRLKGVDYSVPRTYFVTLCLKGRARTFSGERAAKTVSSVVMEFRAKGFYYLYVYCVMPDHVHILLRTTPNAPSLSLLVATLKRSIHWRCRLIGIDVKWQSGFYDRVVRDYEHRSNFVNYVLMNPVRAGIVNSLGDYPYCAKVDPWW